MRPQKKHLSKAGVFCYAWTVIKIMNIMVKQLKILGTIIILLLIGLVVPKYLINNEIPPKDVNFEQEGYLLKDVPGKNPGWYLSYERPGQSGLMTELKIAEPSMDLLSGMRVYVEGTHANEIVAVTKIGIVNAYKRDLIWLDSPRPNQTVINPITLHGYAKGNWYFEASFPIKVLDANGVVLGQVAAEAQENWMTDEYVEFLASLPFTNPTTETGTLVLEKDNPSGLPQNADELRIPIKFGTEGRAVKLYYYNPNKDTDAQGNLLCSRQGLVAVDRQITITDTPIQDTIKLLMAGALTNEEKSQGLTTDYPLSGLELKGANLAERTLTLEFADPQNKTSGGSCRVAVLWAQIEATAKQFPGITTVKFIPKELFQP